MEHQNLWVHLCQSIVNGVGLSKDQKANMLRKIFFHIRQIEHFPDAECYLNFTAPEVYSTIRPIFNKPSAMEPNKAKHRRNDTIFTKLPAHDFSTNAEWVSEKELMETINKEQFAQKSNAQKERMLCKTHSKELVQYVFARRRSKRHGFFKHGRPKFEKVDYKKWKPMRDSYDLGMHQTELIATKYLRKRYGKFMKSQRSKQKYTLYYGPLRLPPDPLFKF